MTDPEKEQAVQADIREDIGGPDAARLRWGDQGDCRRDGDGSRVQLPGRAFQPTAWAAPGNGRSNAARHYQLLRVDAGAPD